MGVVLGAVGVLAGLLGGALHAANAAAGRTSEPSFWEMGLVAALAYGTGALLLRDAGAPRIRLVLGAIAAAQGLSLVGFEWAFLGDVPGRDGVLWVGSWLWTPAFVTIATVLPLLLPDGQVLSRRWRPALWLAFTAVVISTLSWALTPYHLQDFPDALAGSTNPVGVDAVTDPAIAGLGIAILLLAVVTTVVAVVQRWRAAVDVERQQLKWVVLGYVATLLLLVLAQLLPAETAGVGAALGMVPLPLAIGVAVLRYGLWDVDLVISRTLVYGLLSGLVAAVYAGTVWLLGEVVEEGTGAPIVATTAVALLTLPMRTWLQRHVNRWVHGATEEPYAVLARLGERLGSAAAPEELVDRVLPEVVEQVARSLRAQEAVLTLRDGTVASYGGGGTGDPVAVDLVYAGERLGTLSARRPAGFDEADVRALDRLAAQAAVAAHTVLLSREAQRAREAVVLAREEERRRLRRDLHDGVGPSLAALALHAETARDLAVEDPAAATRLLDRLVPRLNASVADVRALVHELRPPTLDELGLATAVHELADRLSTGRTRVETHAGELPDLPAAVEVAAYHIAGEAAGNAVRHADAGTVRIRLCVKGDALEVRVEDDGHGLPASPRPGLGTTTMRERAEELGGRLDLSSGTTGTTVTATLPLQEAPVGVA